MTGTWNGTYSYDPTDQYPRLGSVAFTLTLKQGWFRGFSGTVTDTGPGGMPETGRVEGRFSYPRIRFTKWMPISYMTLEDGGLVSVRMYLIENGYKCDRDIPHEPIDYQGEFSTPGTAHGVWIMRKSKISAGEGWEILFPETTGTWTLALSAV